MAFSVLLGFYQGDATRWLFRLEYMVPLLIGSSAMFFIPESLAKKGLMKFLHYPLPDWDVLLLGPASHRHWLTHSPILPILTCALVWRYPALMHAGFPMAWMIAGLCIGIGSHLFWDCVGSRSQKIIVVPYWSSMKTALSRIYLLGGAAIALGLGAAFALAPSRVLAAPHVAAKKAKTTPASTRSKNAHAALMTNVIFCGMESKMNDKETEKPQPHLLASGIEFGEGPSVAWDETLYFVDPPTGFIKRMEGGKAIEWLDIRRDGAGVPNGSKFDGTTFFVCATGRREVLAIARDKSVKIIADAKNGGIANGPNDCALDAKGNVYFTDPNQDKAISSSVRVAEKQADGTYQAREFAGGFWFPNGIAVAPDGQSIYVAETNRNRITQVDLNADGTDGARRTFCDLPFSEVGPDGIRFDDQGRLFIAHFGGGAIRVLDKTGKMIDSFDAGGKNPTNVAFSADFNTLFVTETASKSVYQFDLTAWRKAHGK